MNTNRKNVKNNRELYGIVDWIKVPYILFFSRKCNNTKRTNDKRNEKTHMKEVREVGIELKNI